MRGKSFSNEDPLTPALSPKTLTIKTFHDGCLFVVNVSGEREQEKRNFRTGASGSWIIRGKNVFEKGV